MAKPLLLTGSLILASCAFGQPNGSPTFEVASIKKAELPQPGGRGMVMFGRRGGPGTDDPGRITWSGASLKAILGTAYDVKAYQINGPDWLDTERFDIVAKVSPGATKEQVNVMWQNLLAERFGVVLHRQSKVFQVEEMVAAKGGVKLKETTLDAKIAGDDSSPDLPPLPIGPPPGGPPPGAGAGGGFIARGPGGPQPGGAPPGAPQLDKNGVPQLTKPGLVMMMTMGPSGPTARMVGKAQTLTQLAAMLGNQLNRPVVDKTGLTARYDFVLEFAPDFGGRMFSDSGPGPGMASGPGDTSQSPNASEPAGSNLVAVIQKQLGLRLVANKAPLDVLIIDKAEKVPTEN